MRKSTTFPPFGRRISKEDHRALLAGGVPKFLVYLDGKSYIKMDDIYRGSPILGFNSI